MEKQYKKVSTYELFSLIEELLKKNQNAIFTVSGNSMWPLIGHYRDQVEVTACDPYSLKKGDIILFQTGSGQYLLHRIIKVTDSGYVTAGDNNTFIDGVFPPETVKAKVIRVIRKGKPIDCDDIKWRMIFWLWMLLFPVRKYLKRGLLLLAKINKRLTIKK